MPLVEIADFNRDGMFDLIYPRPETNEIVVLYNQLPAQSHKSEYLCNSEPNSVGKLFDSDPKQTSTTALVHKVSPILHLAESMPGVPGRLRVVDADLNGFVEIIATLVNKDRTTTTYVFDNIPVETE